MSMGCNAMNESVPIVCMNKIVCTLTTDTQSNIVQCTFSVRKICMNTSILLPFDS